MATMFEIDKATADYARAHDALRDVMQNMEADRTELLKRHLPGLRIFVRKAAEKKAALKEMIEASVDQFEKPKTRILHGVIVGFRKGVGKIDWDDDARVVALIEKHFPDWAETLLRVKKSPIVAGLNELDVKDLRKIGVTAENTGDKVVIKPTDSEIDKLVDALLREDETPEAA